MKGYIYYRKLKRKLYENRYTNRYLTDIYYKTHIKLYASMFANFLYIAVNAISAYVYQTHWFAIFAAYYGIIAMMRLLLVSYIEKNNIGENYKGELKRSRVCAYILMTVNITLSGTVLMMIYYDRGFSYRGYLIYVMAIYTFYTTISAIVEIVKFRRYSSPIMSVSKVIKLATALFSMLFLETAMFAQFGQDTPDKVKKLMIMATGAGICVIVVTMSIYIIVRSSQKLKILKGSSENNAK